MIHCAAERRPDVAEKVHTRKALWLACLTSPTGPGRGSSSECGHSQNETCFHSNYATAAQCSPACASGPNLEGVEVHPRIHLNRYDSLILLILIAKSLLRLRL